MFAICSLITVLFVSIHRIHGDDPIETISVNAGEMATFLCDLPEKYSNKRADFYGPTGRLLVAKTEDDGSNTDRTRFMLEHPYAWTWSLILSDVSDDDAGEYTCRISSSSPNDQTLTIIKRFHLTVLTPPKITDVIIESSVDHGNPRENDQIILKCLARGNPQPKITWHIPGRKFLSSRRYNRNIIAFENKLMITNLSRTTPIDYQCIADNGIPPRDTRTKRILPSISPEMTIQSSVLSSSRLLLNCTIIARPLNSAKWKRNRFEMSNVKRTQINDYTVELLLLLEINEEIYGMYECEADNQFKVSKAFINVDESILINATTTTTLPKQRRISSVSYAQVELLLNRSTICQCHCYWIILIHLFLFHYSNGFYTKR